MLGWRLALRDLRSRYRQTLLGFVWMFLPVILTTLLFVFLNEAALLNTGNMPAGVPYVLYAFLGSLLWQLFVGSVTTPMSIVSGSSGMVARIQFPREALLISALVQVLVNFGVKLVVAIPLVFAFIGPPPLTALLLPLPVLGIVLLGFAIGQLLIPLNLIFHDVQMALGSLLSVLVFLAPVGYAPEAGSTLARLVYLNPVTPLLQVGRSWLTTGWDPHVTGAALVTVGAAALFVLGLVLYLVLMPIVIERQSA